MNNDIKIAAEQQTQVTLKNRNREENEKRRKELLELATKLNPFEDKVVCVYDEDVEKEEGGIVIPTSSNNKTREATVIAVGPGRMCDATGERIPMYAQVGMRVVLPFWGATDVDVLSNKIAILDERMIQAWLETVENNIVKDLRNAVATMEGEAE